MLLSEILCLVEGHHGHLIVNETAECSIFVKRLDEEDKDAVMRSIMDAYWESKNENSEKYSHKDKDGENK